jgi:hypothetical protein
LPKKLTILKKNAIHSILCSYLNNQGGGIFVAKKRNIRATVQKIVNGRHGRYAVATSEDVLGSITFSLSFPYWKEVEDPDPGTIVNLSNLRKKKDGWRAMRARDIKLEEKESSA